MAEILVSGGESAGTATPADIYDSSSRAARKRRIEIRRNFDVYFNAQRAERKLKRRKMCVTAPIMEAHDMGKDVSFGEDESCCSSGEEAGKEPACRSSLDHVVDDSRIASAEPATTLADDCPAYGIVSVCGRRRDMEDAVSIHPDIFRHSGGIEDGYHFYGVFDGHGCSHVAVSCKERMHKIVAEELDRLDTIPPTTPEWKSLMEKSFFRMDSEAASWRGGPDILACRCEFQSPKCDHVGSTAVVSVICDKHIVVANCGDSRAVLCRNGSPVPLSDDHKPDRPDELQRIEEAGGRVIYWDGARVLGVLAMSRAIGDNYLKPFVIPNPDVTVTEREEGDECVILASDGLWDVVTSETACQIVRMILRGSASPDGASSQELSRKACADAATLLTKLALARHSADNISVVVVDLRR